MLIFRISQNVNQEYDAYSTAIVIADSPEAAKLIHPSDELIWNDTLNQWCWEDDPDQCSFSDLWANPNEIEVELIGVAHQSKQKVLCASFQNR